VSAAHAEADDALPVVSWKVLRTYADQDLIVLLGPTSEPVQALAAGRPDLAEPLLLPWRELASDRLRLEAVYLGRQGTGPGSLRLAARTVGLADQLRVPAVLTNTVRYADPPSTAQPTSSMRRGCCARSTADTWTAASGG
jgi:error-prone DNA polymerase